MTPDGDELEDLSARLLALTAALVKLDEVDTDARDVRTRASIDETLRYLDTQGEQVLQEIVRLIAKAKLRPVTVQALRDLLGAGRAEILLNKLRNEESKLGVHVANAVERPPGRPSAPRSEPEQDHGQESAAPGWLAGIAVAIGAGILAGAAAGPLVALLLKESIVKKAIEGAIFGLFAASADKVAENLPVSRRPRVPSLQPPAEVRPSAAVDDRERELWLLTRSDPAQEPDTRWSRPASASDTGPDTGLDIGSNTP